MLAKGPTWGPFALLIVYNKKIGKYRYDYKLGQT